MMHKSHGSEPPTETIPDKLKSKYLGRLKSIYYFLLALITIYLFFLSINLMGSSFNRLSGDLTETILSAAHNPFISLFIGLLITAVIQSSSTTTSMIVALVASGSISLQVAVPMVMGANIGTTITSTIVSLGFITTSKEYRKAISAGVIHDFFNIIMTLIFFPLEYYYRFLSGMAGKIAAQVSSGSNIAEEHSYFFMTSDLSEYILSVVESNFLLIILSFILLFSSIKFLSKMIFKLLVGESKDRIQKYVFNNPYKSFSWGTFVTAAVQSSSITTSLMVPLVATGKVSLKKAFPFILGANIGTTITAFLAAMFKSEAAISVAIVHLIFNLGGILIFLPFRSIRMIPIKMAQKFSRVSQRYRLTAFFYIIVMFFVLPFTLIYLSERNENYEKSPLLIDKEKIEQTK